MNKEDLIYKIVKKMVDLNDSSDLLDYKIIQDNDNFLCDIPSDYRVDRSKNNYIEVYAIDKRNNVISKATFLIYDESDFKNIVFWKKRGNLLEKVTLADYKKDVGDLCLVFAYSEIKEGIDENHFLSYKYEMFKAYINICDYILNELNIFSYVEPTGVMFFNEKDRKSGIIDLDNNRYILKNLGKVLSESMVTDKLFKMFNFYQVKDLYNYYHGGKIYFSKGSIVDN